MVLNMYLVMTQSTENFFVSEGSVVTKHKDVPMF